MVTVLSELAVLELRPDSKGGCTGMVNEIKLHWFFGPYIPGERSPGEEVFIILQLRPEA